MAKRHTYRQLAEIRRRSDYSSGELVEEAANIAIDVGRPPRRTTTLQRGGRMAMQRSASIDYAGINEQYESELTAQRAVGWTEEDMHGSTELPPSPDELSFGSEQVA